MSGAKCYVAVDLGATSGRVILGSILDGKLTLEETGRFQTGATKRGDSIRWDFERIFTAIKAGIAQAAKITKHEISSISVDSWGVDFGLIGKDGKLIEEPYHYRDERNAGMMEKALEQYGEKNLYQETGIQFMPFNTLYQLMAIKERTPELLAKTDKIIFMADLVAYYLCGEVFAEYSMASTSQIMNMTEKKWSQKLFDAFDLPMDIMPDIVKSGSVVGKLTDQMSQELGCGNISVVASASHDTGAAVAAVPAQGDSWAYLSSGTWSLLGVELDDAVINDSSYEQQFTNEGGVENTIRFLKNIMGLWIFEETKRYWEENGEKFSYESLVTKACQAKPFKVWVDTEYSEFMSPGEMPEKLNRFLAKTSQEELSDKGEIVRTIFEALAIRYRTVVEKTEALIGKKIDVLNMVGGGIQNELLCQFTADAIGRKVVAGPVEATASGNIIMQAIALGDIATLSDAREVVKNSFEMKIYEPQESDAWQKHYEMVLAAQTK